MLIVIVMVATITPITGCNCPPKTHPPKTRPPYGPPKTRPPKIRPPYGPPKTPPKITPPKTPPQPTPPTVPGTPIPVTPVPGGKNCPIDALKLGACVDLLSGLVHVGIGDPVVNKCCPLVQGVLGLEAALCLCTTIRAKLLSLNIYLPLALELLASCGLKPPEGFKCPSS